MSARDVRLDLMSSSGFCRLDISQILYRYVLKYFVGSSDFLKKNVLQFRVLKYALGTNCYFVKKSFKLKKRFQSTNAFNFKWQENHSINRRITLITYSYNNIIIYSLITIAKWLQHSTMLWRSALVFCCDRLATLGKAIILIHIYV